MNTKTEADSQAVAGQVERRDRPAPQRWTGIVQAHCSGGFVAVADYMAAMDEMERLRAALARIERWHGEFPETGKTWEETGDPVSYSAAYGSNGERDYMRQVARDALWA